jgi:hypothetical protein
MKYLAIFFALSTFALFGSQVFAQHQIQVDDGSQHYTVLRGQQVDFLDYFYFPVGGGTLMVTPPPNTHSLVWLTGGNTGTGVTSSTPTDILGTLNNYDVVMAANNVEKMRLVSGGGVSVSSLLTVTGPNNFKYVDGNQTAGWVLTENGSGVASWANPGSLSGLVTTATGTAPLTVNGDNNPHSGAIAIALNQGSLTTSTSAITIGGIGKTVGSGISVDLTTGSLSSGGSLTIGGTGLTVGSGITANINLANPNNWTGQQTITGANKFKYVDGNQTAGWILSEDNSGQAVWSNPAALGFVTTATGTSPITVNTDNNPHSGAITIAVITGAVTTPNGTLTLGGTGGKTVAGTLTADLNLGNANIWTGTQTFGGEAHTPVNQVVANPGPVSDQAISATNTYFRVSALGATSLDGIISGGAPSAGRIITISNIGAFPITIINQSSSASAPANQFDLPGGANIILGTRGAITFIYDGTLLRWEVASTN